MGFGSWIKRNILPIAGGTVGMLLGGPAGAAIGAGAGKTLATKQQTGDWGTALKRGATAAGIGYGAGTGISSGLSALAGGGTVSGSAAAGLPSGIGSFMGSGSDISSAFSSFMGGGGGAGGGGAGGFFSGGIGKFLKNPYVIGAGLGLDYYAKKRQQDKTEDAMNEAIKAMTWTPERREGMMKGIRGITSAAGTAAKKRAAARSSAEGRGGGSYGKQVEKIRRQGRETEAKALASTYEPASTGLLPAYAAKGKDALSAWMDDVLGLGGTMAGNYMLGQSLKAY